MAPVRRLPSGGFTFRPRVRELILCPSPVVLLARAAAALPRFLAGLSLTGCGPFFGMANGVFSLLRNVLPSLRLTLLCTGSRLRLARGRLLIGLADRAVALRRGFVFRLTFGLRAI